MSENQRAEWLDSLGLSDPALAADLRALLGESSSAALGGFLEQRLVSILARPEPPGADSPVLPEGPRYTIGQEHARGGMGRILRARDTYLGRTVAIKELLHDGPGAEARFMREAKLTARLQHPSVVPVHDGGRWQATGKLFYSMKLVSGRSLAEVTAAAGSLRDRLGLVPNVLAVADAVAYAHSERIIHRDLKPANVLVGAYGETLVVDWGLAKDLASMDAPTPGAADLDAELANRGTHHESDMTAVGAVLGTPAFMPPEQARGAAVDERADVYALGAMLYFVVSRKPPYDGVPAHALIKGLLTGPPPPLLARQPETPPDLCAIVEKAMAREPSERYPSAKELAEDLRRFLTGQMVSAREYSWRQIASRWVQRHRAVATLSASFLLALVIGTTAFVLREQRLRARAEASSARADAQSRTLLIENGRRELAQGRPYRAAAYLSDAYQHERHNRALHYLVTEAARPLEAHSTTLRGHAREVSAIAFSPDASRLATGSSDMTVRLWDAASGDTIRVLRGPDLRVQDVAWSPDGRLVASGDNVVCVWDAESGALLHKLAHPGYRVQFSPDGRWLVAASMRGWLWVWDTATWKVVVEQPAHQGRIYAIAFHPNGKRAVTTGWDGVVAFWELPSWKPGVRLADHRNAVATAAFSADGRWLMTGDADVTLHVRNADDGTILHTLRLPEGSRWMNAFFSPDGRTIVTTTVDGMIREWHAMSGDLLASIDAIPDGKLFDGALSPDGSVVATAGITAGDLWRLGMTGGRRVVGDVSHDASALINPAVYSRDGSRLTASIESANGSRNVLHIWDAHTGAKLHAWEDVASGAYLAANADLSRILAAGDSTQAPRLWDTTRGRVIACLDHGGKRIRAVAMSTDGALLATASDDPSVRLWEGENGSPIGAPLTLTVTPSAIALSPDGRQLAVAGANGGVRLQDIALGKVALEFQAHPTWIEGIEYSSDGAWLVTAGRQALTAKVWNAHTGELRATLTGHGDNLVRATFSPDGSLVATVSVDNTARIWDARTGEQLRVIRGPAFTARFSADGRELLTTGMRNYAVIWDVALDSRSPDVLAALVARESPWRLLEGQLELRTAR